jgi:hypothetical protein
MDVIGSARLRYTCAISGEVLHIQIVRLAIAKDPDEISTSNPPERSECRATVGCSIACHYQPPQFSVMPIPIGLLLVRDFWLRGTCQS